MKIQLNGINLFFDVEGASLRANGDAMREIPTVILLQGGPGADHSIYKPYFTALTDVAQVIYLDHRGNGRSDDGPAELWTLAQWADYLVAFCDALGIVKPSFTALRLVEWWRWRARHTIPIMLASWRG